MTTFRRSSSQPQSTTILDITLQDSRLSWKARGLLAFMLSKPANFKFSDEELAMQAPDGMTSVRSGIKELEQLGYVVRYAVRDKGIIVSWEMDVYETPSNIYESEAKQCQNKSTLLN